MEYQVYTMYVNRKDLLIQAIRSIDAYESRIVVLDNSPEQDLTLAGFSGEIYRPEVPLFCSQSYNLILQRARQRRQEVFFMMHSDARGSNEVMEQLLNRAEELKRQRVRWGVLFTSYDILCLCHTATLQDFRWDPCLPLYYTDVDYYYRLRLAGIPLIETGLSVEHQEGGSTVSRADRAIRVFVETNFPGWREYYRRKWGGERDQERFRTPFADEARP